MTMKLLTEQLESLVDHHGLQLVLECLSDVCAEKADHVSVNWQDRVLAGRWDRASKAINSVVYSEAVVGLPA